MSGELRWFQVTYVVEATDPADAVEAPVTQEPERVEELSDG